ncbi:hypothetical protein [Candidatus Nitrospira allomarina]|uniref:MotA/TolQ/ExbB proton channel domain-containing protein n=1 Tax=Candidatus Nitrospira allomarina TaxID=3020900 RepID=A0AA96JXD7_9BACT|nr:hypothetical protein [Candidatus Nitrospira allomarina]WNM58906.1 hypothetical protein PP769_03830 [Candidatus Nitrospira allomarina]
MTTTFGLWEFLSRDVTFLGGPHSPMLSWLGSVGIVVFFLWHILKMRKETASVRLAFNRIRPMLEALANERKEIDRNRFTHHPVKGFSTHVDRAASTSSRLDSEDIHTLDSGMQQEPIFRDPWAQYRMTLILEQVPWFVDPRIFSTKRAAEVFTHEALIAKHVNLPFYRQLPSFITGLGLLLTFLALFIGLGKLHAEGSEIVGIQGLINGLAGKFLTSIVGLIVANVFTFIEKPLMARLISDHYVFLGLIDQLFPRKTMEQMLEQLTAMQGRSSTDHSASGGEGRPHTAEWETNRLAGSTADLTAAIQTLTILQQEQHAEIRRTVSDLSRVMTDRLQGPLNDLNDAIHSLTKWLKEANLHPMPTEKPFEDRPALWKTSSYARSPSMISLFDKIGSWPKRPGPVRHRRTG